MASFVSLASEEAKRRLSSSIDSKQRYVTATFASLTVRLDSIVPYRR